MAAQPNKQNNDVLAVAAQLNEALAKVTEERDALKSKSGYQQDQIAALSAKVFMLEAIINTQQVSNTVQKAGKNMLEISSAPGLFSNGNKPQNPDATTDFTPVEFN